MNIDITEIVIALIGLMSAVITSVAVPLIKSRTTANQQIIVKSAAATAVLAAQQLYSANDGPKKKEYAEKYITELLKKYGITLSTEEVSAAAEAALKEIKAAAPPQLW